MSLIVICPSRGRPGKASEAYESFISTKTLADSEMVFVVDDDDDAIEYARHDLVAVSFDHEGGGMGPPLNAAVKALAPSHDIIGFVGDDHRFRTDDWDLAITDALVWRPGLAYGNDLGRHDIPTQVFITSRVVQALGWMALPGAKHLYLDNTWAELGHRAGCITFLPAVVIEHMHPVFGKAAVDEGYIRVNAPAMYEHDSRVFGEWISSGQVLIDVETVKAAIA